MQIGLGILTFAGSGVIVHSLNAHKERREFYRARLESLFVELWEFQQQKGLEMLGWSKVIESKISFQSVAERINELTGHGPDHYATINMLVNLYFPELLAQFRKLENVNTEETNLYLELRVLTESGQSPARLFNRHLVVMKNFEAELRKLQSDAVENGRRLGLIKRDEGGNG